MRQYDFISNKENRHLKLNIKSIVIYLIIYALIIWLWQFVGGYMFLYMLIMFSILPFYSILSLIVATRYSEFKLSLSEKEVCKNQVLNVGLIVSNRSYMVVPVCKIRIGIENDFYKSSASTEYNMSIAPRNKTKTTLPLVFDRCGGVIVRVEQIELRDVFGFISHIYKSTIEQKICVLPKGMAVEDINRESFMTGLTQNEENELKGNDFSDVSNIREYIPGDRIKDIHWKASARTDELMVKERIRLSENQLSLLVDLSGESSSVDKVISYSYNIVRCCIEDGIPVDLMWWVDATSQLAEYQVMSLSDIRKAFLALYEDGISKNTAYASDYIHNVKVKLSRYVKVSAEGEEVKVSVIE